MLETYLGIGLAGCLLAIILLLVCLIRFIKRRREGDERDVKKRRMCKQVANVGKDDDVNNNGSIECNAHEASSLLMESERARQLEETDLMTEIQVNMSKLKTFDNSTSSVSLGIYEDLDSEKKNETLEMSVIQTNDEQSVEQSLVIVEPVHEDAAQIDVPEETPRLVPESESKALRYELETMLTPQWRRQAQNNSQKDERKRLFVKHTWNTKLQQNKLFEVVFDIPTPRPHFIVKFVDRTNTKTIESFSNSELRQFMEVIKLFRTDYDLDREDMILSFHTGYWATQASFHAHLCVDTSVYLKIYESLNVNLEGFTLPRKTWRIRELENVKWPTKSDLYIQNVKNYANVCSESSNKYRLEEVKAIRKLPIYGVATRTAVTNIESFVNNFGPIDIKIEFDTQEPKLKFQVSVESFDNNDDDKSTLAAIHLIKAMCNFAQREGYFNKQSGCHLCIVLPPTEADSLHMCGYLHISGDQFYRLHPNPQLFLENFEKLDNYYIST